MSPERAAVHGGLSYNTTQTPLPGRHRRRTPPPCPCCGTPGGICDAHRERLAGIREALWGEVRAGGQYGQRSDRRGYKPPQCCNPQCAAPRPRGVSYCTDCQANGWSEEDLT